MTPEDPRARVDLYSILDSIASPLYHPATCPYGTRPPVIIALAEPPVFPLFFFTWLVSTASAALRNAASDVGRTMFSS